MISQLLHAVFTLLTVLGLIWLGLALMSAKWPSWKPVRSGYVILLKATVLGITRYLWAPRFQREGGGQVAQLRIAYQDSER